ncbi:HD-GYP domain-containing protein [Ideonella sp. A 288]|uniref:HD-GYP domain-containing protein n=1 Tax=Ideonella sp. A 288 TaxID=1962181 RepID=UPI000B4B19CA|nr:HD domain-containing phosphohydrolase [Ideonella sp. A 288]
MQFSQLATVQNRIVVGAPLPFNVRDVDRTLLLARGHVIDSRDQLEALFHRGALVDLAEVLSPTDIVKQAPAEALPGLWTDSLSQVGDALRHSAEEGFAESLEEATPAVLALIERDKDLAILQVLRQDATANVQYGVDHSAHAAITAFLVSQRLGWSAEESQRLFKAALTMNISMLELQGQLAIQDTPVTPEQRAAIYAHPEFSVRMLELSGVDDGDWLRAVAQHHERPDGSGYPYGITTMSDMAALVQRADIYTARLSPRIGRAAIPADRAGRAMFMQDPGDLMTAALVKEFGVYPPGCFVRLVSGETGMVVRRGPTVMTPVVAVMTTTHGVPITEPKRRDTSEQAFTVAAVVPTAPGMGRLSIEQLLAVAAL